jgi:hypothetical protein
LIVEDLIGLSHVVFPFALEGFLRKNLVLLVSCLIIFHCIVGEFILVVV